MISVDVNFQTYVANCPIMLPDRKGIFVCFNVPFVVISGEENLRNSRITQDSIHCRNIKLLGGQCEEKQGLDADDLIVGLGDRDSVLVSTILGE
jgi:hypothetical protein